MNRLQPIYDLAALCAAKNVKQAILCPGSRNAPLILAFSRHPDITCRSISDERSAAFIALGIAQQTERAAVLVSTSGSAAYNFAPGVAEAFFAKSPLIVITADRPTEWVGQQDGQTIYQAGIFGQHVKKCYQLPQEYEHPDNGWAINRMVNEAINLAHAEPMGPVHLNVPLREPLYPGDKPTEYSANLRIMNDLLPVPHADEETQARIAHELHQSRRVLIVAGQAAASATLRAALESASTSHQIPVVGDVLSNVHGIHDVVRRADLFLGGADASTQQALQPDLLITFGDSVISKPLKVFLRSFPPQRHWHIQVVGDVADTFKSVTSVIRLRPEAFFQLLSVIPAVRRPDQIGYQKRWLAQEGRIEQLLGHYLADSEFGEAKFVNGLMRSLPPVCHLHLANSMSVRYGVLVGLTADQQNVCVYANRGTSGIDGCTSTAVGHALTSVLPNILITGDVAFFYDRNAFWHNYPMPNLRIVLLNNHGGGIFKMIDGPGEGREVDEFQVTRQALTGKHIAAEFGFDYYLLDEPAREASFIDKLFTPSDRPGLLEVQTPMGINKNFLSTLKQKIKDNYER